MADENDVSEELEETKGKKKGLPTFVIIAIVAVLTLAIGVFVGKMMFGGGDKAPDDKAKIEKKKDEQTTEKSDKKVKEEDNKKDEEVKKEEDTEQTSEEKDTVKVEDTKNEEAKDGENKDSEKPKKVKKGKGNLKLEEFLINLSDPLIRRYVKFVVNLRLTDIAYVDRIKQDENIIPEIRDKIFDIVSDKTYKDLKSSAGKIMLKEEIMISVNEILNENIKVEPVIKVMFSKYILQ